MTAEGAADLAPETAEDLYHGAPCGYLTTTPDGTLARVNRTFLRWTGYDEAALVGRRRFVDLLSPGSRIYHETHYVPLLVMQEEVREISLELLRADGSRLPVLVNSLLVRDASDQASAVRTTVFDATVRREYERELVRARHRAEASEASVREVARSLQRSLLQGSVTEGAAFQVETRYRPAVATLEVGGDWYDSFLLRDGATLAVSVGDVVGRGIAAAGAMGQIRSALRALAGSESGPGRLLDQLDRFVERVPDARLATVAYAEIDLTDGSVRYACAGHLPPLVIDDTGRADLLWDGRSPPLAAIRRDTPRPEGTTTLGGGSRLLLYTDGLIERRRRGIDAGLDRLVEAASKRFDEPIADMADALMLDLLADEDARDDVCLLVTSFDADP
ncbi:MAG TPA: SpoIIE family protein phosphatase [Aquihabitans sp.]|nr:SpoIIE family protein phosphatase [Aquihabitans sp.]